jgi:hypothetical protein
VDSLNLNGVNALLVDLLLIRGWREPRYLLLESLSYELIVLLPLMVLINVKLGEESFYYFKSVLRAE